MKKGWKIFWLVCAILAVVGIALCAVGLATGARFYEMRYWLDRKFDDVYDYDDYDDAYDDYDDYGNQHTEDLGNGKLENEMHFQEVDEIDIEAEGIEVQLSVGDVSDFVVYTDEIDETLKEELRIKAEGRCLEIEMNEKNILNHLLNDISEADGQILKIIIPANHELREASFSVEQGRLVVDEIRADELSVDIGMGEVSIEQFFAKEADFSCGAGNAQFTGKCTGDVDIECGTGSVIYHVQDKELDYNYELSCGVGSISIDDQVFSGVAKEHRINNNSLRNIDIECGVGSVELYFAD